MAKITTIHKALKESLLTWLVAETCLERADIKPTKELVNGLVARANFHFNNDKLFKKGILSKANHGNAGRDYLYLFMGHWIKAKYWEKHNIMPDEYKPYQENVPDYK